MSPRRRRRPRQFRRAAGAFALGFGVTLAAAIIFLHWPQLIGAVSGDLTRWSELPERGGAAYPAPRAVGRAVTLAFVGDIRADRQAAPGAAGVSGAWREAHTVLVRADLAIGNLETTLAGSRPPVAKRFTFQSSPDLVVEARSAGIGLLSLANNHALDYGRQAMLETVRRVRSDGVRVVGAGKDAEEAFAPELVELRGMRIGFLSFSRVLPTRSWAAGHDRAGVASGYSSARVLAAIDSLAPRVDAVVVLMHWGKEAQDTPRTADRQLAEAMIHHGATAVIGHHPHVLQGVEWTRGAFVAYSLGNFLSPGSRQTDTGVLLLTLRKGEGVTAARFVPLRLAGGAPRRVTPMEAGQALSRLSAAVAPAGLSVASDGQILAHGAVASSDAGEPLGGSR